MLSDISRGFMQAETNSTLKVKIVSRGKKSWETKIIYSRHGSLNLAIFDYVSNM